MSDTNSTWNPIVSHLVEASDNHIDARNVRREDSLSDDLGLNSLLAVNLVLELEDMYEIEFKQEDLQSLHTVGDVQDLVDAKLEHKKQSIT